MNINQCHCYFFFFSFFYLQTIFPWIKKCESRKREKKKKGNDNFVQILLLETRNPFSCLIRLTRTTTKVKLFTSACTNALTHTHMHSTHTHIYTYTQCIHTCRHTLDKINNTRFNSKVQMVR